MVYRVYDGFGWFIMKTIMKKSRKIKVYYMKSMKNGSQNIGNFEPPPSGGKDCDQWHQENKILWWLP